MGSDTTLTPRARHSLLLGIAVILIALSLRLVFAAFSVPTSSMEPTLLPGDHIIVVRYLARQPRRGDVVVFEDSAGTTLVKRVIGLPGDSVQIEAGRVLVNGEVLAESSYVRPSHASGVSVHVVPRGHFFLLGDNRDHSADSREFGFVGRDAMVGRARLVYWSSSEAPEGRVRWQRLLHMID